MEDVSGGGGGGPAHIPPAAGGSSSSLPVVPSDTTIPALARKLRDDAVNALVVSDSGGRVVDGIVSERDICRAVIGAGAFSVHRYARRPPEHTWIG
jgi:CBS domain-containing protein